MTHPTPTLSRAEARRLAIAYQGLHAIAPFGKGKNGVYETIAHLGYVQIDTISVAERAHNHILWSRVPNYKPTHLHDLQLKDRRILEFWAHAAAYLPMKDYRFLIPTMDYFRNDHDPWPKSDQKTIQWVLNRIRDEGPLKSRDFEAPDNQNKTGWWDWKPTKLALQRLFFMGNVMVSHREGFQRVYDITERVLQSSIDTSPPTKEEYAQYLIQSTIRAHGIARRNEMYYLRKGMGNDVGKALNMLTESGSITRVAVKGIDDVFYSTHENLNQSIRVANKVKLLSPFDNAVIQRSRLSDLFDFDFQIECYVPKPKRKYGYYCLPILMGDRFCGRVDVKVDRKTRILDLINMVLVDRLPNGFIKALASGCIDYAKFNQCEKIAIGTVNSAMIKKELMLAISLRLPVVKS